MPGITGARNKGPLSFPSLKPVPAHSSKSFTRKRPSVLLEVTSAQRQAETVKARPATREEATKLFRQLRDYVHHRSTYGRPTRLAANDPLADLNGTTVLHVVAGDPEGSPLARTIVRKLKNWHGLNINAVNNQQQTALDIAEHTGNKATAKLLRDAGGLRAEQIPVDERVNHREDYLRKKTKLEAQGKIIQSGASLAVLKELGRTASKGPIGG
jgi:hypothetical protein